MTYSLHVLPQAEVDITDALGWYERAHAGLGSEFLLCVEESFERICKSPATYAVVHRELRRTFVHRFPYAVYYSIEGIEVFVVAVLYMRRDLQKRQERT